MRIISARRQVVSFLYLVAGIVVGFAAGWLLRGIRSTTSQPAPAATSEPVTTSDTKAEPIAAEAAGEPVGAAADAAAEPVASSHEPDAATEPDASPDAAEPAASTSTMDTTPRGAGSGPVTEPAPTADTVSATIVAPAQASAPAAEMTPADTPIAEAPVAEPATVEAPVTEAPVTETPVAEPATGPVAAEAEPDDLTRITGIGPKMAMALAAAGITTYDQLAGSDEATLRAAVSAAGMRLAPSISAWPERARSLVAAKR
ncbi:helix-hairpin-helix domain-containing protein [Mangrovihabitans endophyticus]|nr:helix-hairpin-helix domain-containing protein [Mangrovihabitans endophyticus]